MSDSQDQFAFGDVNPSCFTFTSSPSESGKIRQTKRAQRRRTAGRRMSKLRESEPGPAPEPTPAQPTPVSNTDRAEAKPWCSLANCQIATERSIPSALINKDDALLAELVAELHAGSSSDTPEGAVASVRLGGDVRGRLFIALQMAVTFNMPSAVRILLEGGARPDAVHGWCPPLLPGIDMGVSEEIIDLLLEHGCDPNSQRPNASALQCALAKGNLGVATKLLARGADINHRTQSDESTALHVSALFRKLESVQFVLRHRSDPEFVNAKDTHDRTALHWAAFNGHVDIARELLDAGADPLEPSNDVVLPVVLRMQPWSAEMARLLLSRSDLGWTDDSGDTMLHIACQEGNAQLASFLLEQGVDINARNRRGRTPLMVVMQENIKKSLLMVLLCHAGLDINVTCDDGHSALIYAVSCSGCAPEILAMLKQAGADIHQRDSSGSSVLFLCYRSQNCDENFDWLLDNGADINTVNDGGESILSMAVDRNQFRQGSKLLEINMDISRLSMIAGPHGRTPLVTALQYRSQSLISTLLQEGCSLAGVHHWLQTEEGRAAWQDSWRGQIVQWLAGECRHAPSLLDSARSAVLRTLGHRDVQHKVKQLGLPKLLELYVVPENYRRYRSEELSAILP